MARDKYISVKQGISGFSFANLGLFTGFADGIYNAVYSLVLIGRRWYICRDIRRVLYVCGIVCK